MSSKLSIIIPVLDSAVALPATLGHSHLQDLRQRGHEVLVVDGGSRDGSVTIARRLADRVVMSGPGRALQMNAGAESARNEVLLFLHVDSLLPADSDILISRALSASQPVWGYFSLRLQGSGPVVRLTEALINWRAALTGIASGTQGIFVERTYFERVGGYDALPAREDAALCRKLRRYGRPLCVPAQVLSANGRYTL